MDGIEIINITADNAEAFHRILQWRRTGQLPPEDPPGEVSPSSQKAIASIRSILEDDGFLALAAHDGYRVVGYTTGTVVLKPDCRKGTLYIDELWVAPPFHRRGIMRALLGEVEILARDRGLSRVRLGVDGDDAVARRSYTEAGFVEMTEMFWDKPL